MHLQNIEGTRKKKSRIGIQILPGFKTIQKSNIFTKPHSAKECRKQEEER